MGSVIGREEDLRANGPGTGALFLASLGEKVFGEDSVPSTIGVPIGKPLYLKSAIDSMLYLQVEEGSWEGYPVGAKLMFKAKPEKVDESSIWWLAETMSASSFSLKHINSGCFVECCRRDDDPQGTLRLRSGMPFLGKSCVEFIVRREAGDEAAPFRLECESMKSIYYCSKANRRAYFVDARIVDWPRVEPGDGDWLIGGVEPALRSGESLREGGHIFLLEKVEQSMVLTLRLAKSEDGQLCTCRKLNGDLILEHKLSVEDRLGDIRSMLHTKLIEEQRIFIDIVLVTDGGEVLRLEDDPKDLVEICS